MWPFSKSKRDSVEPAFEAYCPECGRKLDSVRQICRNELPILTCKRCEKTFDYSYNPSHVFLEVQWQRRNCQNSAMKQLLRESQIPEPKYIRERYWAVYELPEGSTVFTAVPTKHMMCKLQEILRLPSAAFNTSLII